MSLLATHMREFLRTRLVWMVHRATGEVRPCSLAEYRLLSRDNSWTPRLDERGARALSATISRNPTN
jgi:hypothetical protein